MHGLDCGANLGHRWANLDAYSHRNDIEYVCGVSVAVPKSVCAGRLWCAQIGGGNKKPRGTTYILWCRLCSGRRRASATQFGSGSLMPKITYRDSQGNSKTIEVEKGLSVMEGAIQNDIPGIDADCGGSMACATCHVYVEEKWFNKISKSEEAEVDMIDMAYEPKKNSRLSCQLIVSDELDGLIVTTPAKQS